MKVTKQRERSLSKKKLGKKPEIELDFLSPKKQVLRKMISETPYTVGWDNSTAQPKRPSIGGLGSPIKVQQNVPKTKIVKGEILTIKPSDVKYQTGSTRKINKLFEKEDNNVGVPVKRGRDRQSTPKIKLKAKMADDIVIN